MKDEDPDSAMADRQRRVPATPPAPYMTAAMTTATSTATTASSIHHLDRVEEFDPPRRRAAPRDDQLVEAKGQAGVMAETRSDSRTPTSSSSSSAERGVSPTLLTPPRRQQRSPTAWTRGATPSSTEWLSFYGSILVAWAGLDPRLGDLAERQRRGAGARRRAARGRRCVASASPAPSTAPTCTETDMVLTATATASAPTAASTGATGTSRGWCRCSDASRTSRGPTATSSSAQQQPSRPAARRRGAVAVWRVST